MSDEPLIQPVSGPDAGSPAGALSPPAPPGAPPAVERPWSPAGRFGFRFLFAYLLLYLFPFPLSFIPGSEHVFGPYSTFVDSIVDRVGRAVFHVVITVEPNGSGDTTYNYVQLVCWVILALTAAIAWTILDHRRRNYARLLAWLRIYVRFSLATTMISYGAFKVFKSQFPDPALDRLMQPFGDASPMGLLWTFMGASPAYNLFSGACEMLGGLLLTLRRTTLLGVLVSIAVLVNIVMLNFCYDVPVKLYSCHLLAMAIFLAAPDLRRLANLFVFNRPVEPAAVHTLFSRRWAHLGSIVLRTALILAYVGWALHISYDALRSYGDLAPKPPLYGIWNVDEMTVDGKPRPPLVTDAARWRRVIFDYPQTVAIQDMDDSRHRFRLKLDTAKKTMKLSEGSDPKRVDTLAYRQPATGVLVVEGTLKGQGIQARLRRVKLSSFLLVRRGFHWINEYPFNR